MKIGEFATEGFFKGFAKGWSGKPGAAPAKPQQAKVEKSPMSVISPRDMKEIAGAVLKGQPLDSRQTELLRNLYHNL